jgi:pimeloyl-ACP methyl ester carboxylesterase
MSKTELYEVRMPVDRWSISAFSPTDIRNSEELSEYAHPVIVHPGWGKTPKNHIALLNKLTDAGFLAIGVDTRYGYTDQQLGGSRRPRVLTQSYRAGKTNPYFADASREDNRWQYRRPTALLYLCDQLGLKERSYIGHSEGARIVALAGLAKASLTRQVIIVNGAGTGNSEKGGRRMVHSNANAISKLARGKMEQPLDLVLNGLRSTVYGATHLKRTMNEKEVIQSAKLWPIIDELNEENVAIDVLHARKDELVSFKDSLNQANLRPEINFIATVGSHSNIYEYPIIEEIVGLVNR